MNTYKEGYQAGWASYLEICRTTINGSFEKFLSEAQVLAEKAEHALPPYQQCDYWLGYHHGRTAAKTRLLKHPVPNHAGR
jgi:hypothetical protein